MCFSFFLSGSSEYESASQHSSSSSQGITASAEMRTKAPDKTKLSPAQEILRREKTDSRAQRSNSVAGSELRLPPRFPPENYSLSYPRFHRRETGDLSGSPSRVQHRRIQSLSISPTVNSSRSTSGYSTLSERSAPVVVPEDTESVLSSKSRATTQTQVEQSRVDTGSVIDELLRQGDISRSVEEESPGLQIYVDRSRGDVVVAGPDMERYAVCSTCILI